MKLITIRARVKLDSEAKIEANLLNESFEETEKDTFLSWKKVTFPVAVIIDILQYDNERCIVNLNQEPWKYFVREKHALLYKRWQELVKSDPNPDDKANINIDIDDVSNIDDEDDEDD